MVRMDMIEGSLGNAAAGADAFFALGLLQASGREAPVDLIAAHRWFNIAAARGHTQAAQLRREVAEQMSDAEIGMAQRSARNWLREHPLPCTGFVAHAAA
jgi:TPR repeat protein